jgi:hypothetical protein
MEERFKESAAASAVPRPTVGVCAQNGDKLDRVSADISSVSAKSVRQQAIAQTARVIVLVFLR